MAKYKRRIQTAYGLSSPLPGIFPSPIIARRAPTAADTGYPLGQLWIYKLLNDAFVLTSIVNGLANWEPLTITTAGIAPISKFVVASDGSSGYLTIQSAITAAVTAGGNATVYVRPGTYVENLTLATTVDIVGAINSGVTITGVHIPPAAGRVQIQNCTLTSATHIFSSAVAGTASITLIACNFTVTNGFIFNLTNWTGALVIGNSGDTGSTNNGVVSNVTTAPIAIFNSSVGAGVGQTMVTKSSSLIIDESTIACPITVSGACAYSIIAGSVLSRTFTTVNTATGSIENSTLSTGATAAINHGSANALTVTNVVINSSNVPVINGAGAGAIKLSGVEFVDGSNLAATLTLNHSSETRSTKLLNGDAVYRVNTFTAENDVIQAYAVDATAAGAADRNAIEGNLQVTSGNGGHTPDGVQGAIFAIAGSNMLTSFGVRGFCNQADGSIIASTAAGVEGHLNILEANTADQPQFFAFGVKGYLDSVDTAGATPATCRMAGLGSLVEYNTPFNGAVYGVNVSRLDQGVGAGTAGLAAYGVTQGIRGAGLISDWLYGLDLYNGAAGIAYTTADVRLWNTATITSAAAGVTLNSVSGDDIFLDCGDNVGVNKVAIRNLSNVERASINSRGDIAGRNINVTNVNIPAFYASPIVQSNLNTGVAPTGVAGDINLIMTQGDNIMQEFVITAQAILAPRMTATGLEIGGDQIATNGWEYNWGANTPINRFAFTAQTSAAFFIEATFNVATVANVEYLWLGFRRDAANNASFAAYTDGAMIGLYPTTAATVGIIAQSLNGPAWGYTNTTNAWANGTVHTVRVNVSAAGVVTYLIDGVAPAAIPAVQTFDAGDIIIPWIGIKQAAAAFTAVKLTQLAVGYQN